MMKGIVKWFNEKKGFGFIVSEETGADIFVHCSEILDSESPSLVEGEGTPGPKVGVDSAIGIGCPVPP